MNRRSILAMLGLAPLVAACGHKDEVRTPLDGLMKEGKRPWWEAGAGGGPVQLGVDLAKPGSDQTVVALLRQQNPLADLVMRESEGPYVYNRGAIRTELPGVDWAKLYKGVS